MKCSVCGSENLEGSAYCEDCGARLPAGVGAVSGESGGASSYAAPAPAPTPAPPPPPLPPTPVMETVEMPVAAASPAPPPYPAPAEEPAATGGTVACAACGAENPSYEAYCEDCGASLTAARAGGGLPPAPPLPPPVGDVSPAPVPTPTQVRHRLILADSAQEFPMNKDEITLGRRSPADGIFPDVDLTDADVESYISRRHGRILNQDGRFLYEDIGSSNGSFLNGTRLQSGVQSELHDGDRLRLGKTEMIYRSA